jgi:glycosyltransferase involved in cell wall biosynthesis
LHHIKPRTLAAVWRSSRLIRSLLSERDIDIVAPDAPRDAFTCGLAKIGTRTKMVWFVRLTAPHNLDRILERMADGMIGVSEATRRRFSPSVRVSARYRIIFNGVDLRHFSPCADRAAVRRDLDLPTDRFLLLFVGQIKEGKGVLDIVEAMVQLMANPPAGPRPLLLIIGTPTPPAILDEIARRAAANGIAKDVRILAQQDQIHRWIQAADVLVSGSHEDTEGMSRVLFEAMACGTIPVATDIRGNREALNSETGILVPERAPAAIAEAVAGLMGASRERLEALRQAGLRRVREHFDITQHARAVERYYHEVMARTGY